MTETVLDRAIRMQAEAAAVGFDWPGLQGIFEKLDEELRELRGALDNRAPISEIEAEIGDLMFVLVNLARRLDVSPASALSATCVKFDRRFGYVCDQLKKSGRSPETSNLEEMEALWQTAKVFERKET